MAGGLRSAKGTSIRASLFSGKDGGPGRPGATPTHNTTQKVINPTSVRKFAAPCFKAAGNPVRFLLV